MAASVTNAVGERGAHGTGWHYLPRFSFPGCMQVRHTFYGKMLSPGSGARCGALTREIPGMRLDVGPRKTALDVPGAMPGQAGP